MFSGKTRKSLFVAGAAVLGALTVSASALSMFGARMWDYTYFATAAKQTQVGWGFDQCSSGRVWTQVHGQRTNHYTRNPLGWCDRNGGGYY